MEYYKRKISNCGFDLCTQDAPAQHWCEGLHFTCIASTLRASSKTLPGKHWTAARASVFGGRCGWGAPTQQHEQLEQMGPAANGQGDDPSSSAPPLHMRLWKTSPTPPPLPPPKDPYRLSTEQNIDLSVAVCSQASLPAFSVLFLSCLVYSGL